MKQKIYIIEDDPLIRNELKILLQSNGYEDGLPALPHGGTALQVAAVPTAQRGP